MWLILVLHGRTNWCLSYYQRSEERIRRASFEEKFLISSLASSGESTDSNAEDFNTKAFEEVHFLLALVLALVSWVPTSIDEGADRINLVIAYMILCYLYFAFRYYCIYAFMFVVITLVIL